MAETPLSCLIDLTVAEFTDELASKSPLPGGGSASALAGALGAALTSMVAALTIGRKRYAKHEAEMAEVRDAAGLLRARLLALVDADVQAYQEVLAAYQMPKEPESQAARRAEAIQAALLRATEAQIEAADQCLKVLELAAVATAHGSRSAASDAAAGALLAHAGLQACVRNVHTNLALIRKAADCDDTRCRDTRCRDTRCRDMGGRARQIAAAGETVLARALTAADSEVFGT